MVRLWVEFCGVWGCAYHHPLDVHVAHRASVRYNLFSGPSDFTCHVMLSKVVALMLPWCPRNGWWDAQAPELLDTLFTMGTKLLVEKLPDVWSGAGAELAVPQDEEHMTRAAKMVKQDGLLDFSQPAETLHNKVHYPRVCACPRCM